MSIVTVHNRDVMEFLDKMLRELGEVLKSNFDKSISLVDAMMREIAIHLRSDQSDPYISLYAHSKFVAALTSLKIQDSNCVPYLVLVKTRIEDMVNYATIDVFEYLAGLSLYSYFGLLGVMSLILRRNHLHPDIHIVSESSTELMAIIPKNILKEFLEELQKLANDLNCNIDIEMGAIDQGKYKSEIVDTLKPQYKVMLLANTSTCNICHTPISDTRLITELKRGFKKLIVCEYCIRIININRLLAKGKMYSLVEGCEGLILYPKLNICVINHNNQGYALVTRTFNPNLVDTLDAPIIDIYVNDFRKDIRLIGAISFAKCVNSIKEQEKLHELLSFYQFAPYFLSKILNESDTHSLEVTSSYGVFQTKYLSEVSKLLSKIYTDELNQTTLSIVKMGTPGLSYQKLKTLVSKVDRIPNAVLAIHNDLNVLTLGDIEVISMVKSRLGYYDVKELCRRLLRTREFIEGYLNAIETGDIVEKYYLKSEILLKISEMCVEEKEGSKENMDWIFDIKVYPAEEVNGSINMDTLSELFEDVTVIKAIVKMLYLEDFIMGVLA